MVIMQLTRALSIFHKFFCFLSPTYDAETNYMVKIPPQELQVFLALVIRATALPVHL